jgi:hypothetical protein
MSEILQFAYVLKLHRGGRRPLRNEATWPNCPHAGAAACEARMMGSARAGMVGLTRSAMTVAVGAMGGAHRKASHPQGFFVSRFRDD